MSINTTASIRARLLNRAKSEGTEFQLYLVRYACERFLYRLGASGARDQCVLKGASLLAVWMEEPYRATRDIDILALGANDEETVRGVMSTICNVPCPEDGLLFDVDTLDVSAIRDDQRYGGQRARMRALLGTARITVQVDFGFAGLPTKLRCHAVTAGADSPVSRLCTARNAGVLMLYAKSRKAMDAIALARRHLWLAPEGFSLSAADPDIQEPPVALYHPLADSLVYAA